MSGFKKEDVQRAATGRWRDILASLGNIPTELLDGQNHPCPKCGGTDRFNVCRKSFDETGTVFCNKQCGISGDGFRVLMTVNGWTFPEALKAVGEFLNLAGTQSLPAMKPKTTTTMAGVPFPKAVERLRRSVARNLPDGVTIPDEPIQYRYNDADGSPVGVVLRWNCSDGEKEIRQLSTEGDGWQWSWKSTDKPLWKLADILKAETVYVVEGEKTVEAVESFDLTATTSAGGSGATAKSDWSVLDGKKIIIVPDHDKPGRKYRDKVIQLIQEQAPAATVEVADLFECWPEIPEAGDAYDWSEAHDSKPPEWFQEELRRIAKPAPTAEFEKTVEGSATPGQKRKVPTLKLTRSEDIVEEQLSWLWKNRFLFGHVNIIAGDPGLGKSMVAVDAAARVSRGLDWPDGSSCEMGTVIYATTEDGYADTVKPRLSAANADHSKIVFLEGIEHPDGEGPMFLDEHLAMLDWHLNKTEGVKLLVLDTLQSFIGDKVNTNNNSSSRRVMTPLKRLAEKHRVAVLAIEHMTKSKTERKDNASYRVQGSIAFIGAARSVWICCKHPDDDQKRILQASKTNLAPDGEGFGLSFGITGPTGRPYIEWDESNIETPIAELLSGDTGEADQTRATEFQRCCEYLRGYLTEAKPTNEVKAACKSEMFSEATIRRAKDHLQIGSEQRDRKWFWTPSEAMLAGQESDAQDDEHLSQMFIDEHLTA